MEAWAAERLTPAERQRVREARIEAYRELERLVEQEESEAVLIQQAGLLRRNAVGAGSGRQPLAMAVRPNLSDSHTGSFSARRWVAPRTNLSDKQTGSP